MNNMVDRYISIVDNISLKYNYPDNIKHLLYIIVPAFIIKYGVDNENIIIECLANVPIIITGKEDPKTQALYVSSPYIDNGVKTKKYILLNRYNNIDFIQLLDNLIHELNHAVNSYKNEIIIDNDSFYLRTGLLKTKYDKSTLKIIDKNDSYILEEIINVKQTETIIDIIVKLAKENNYPVNIENTLYAIKNSFQGNYNSKSYLILKHFCKVLLDNKTFLYTLENLRINGNIDDIELWFDDIYGNGGYKHLIDTLIKLRDIQNKKVLFKKQKIKDLARELVNISNKFNNNSNLR